VEGDETATPKPKTKDPKSAKTREAAKKDKAAEGKRKHNWREIVRIFRCLGNALLSGGEAPWFEVSMSTRDPKMWVSMTDVLDKDQVEKGLEHFIRQTGEVIRMFTRTPLLIQLSLCDAVHRVSPHLHQPNTLDAVPDAYESLDKGTSQTTDPQLRHDSTPERILY
jgi:hypothetical protein